MKRIIAIACLVLVLMVGFFRVRNPAPSAPTAPVVVMPMPYSIPLQRVSLFDAWVPRTPSWGWIWRLKEQIQGRPKTFDLGATLVDFSGAAAFVLTNHSLASPQFGNTNGLQVWLLDNARLSALREAIRKTASPDILSVAQLMTADRMEARLTSGNTVLADGFPSSVGLTVALLPRVRRDSTDLITIVTYSEAITNQLGVTPGSARPAAVSIQTNLAVAARIQIPKGTSVFLLDGPSTAPNHKRLGVLLSVNPPAAKK